MAEGIETLDPYLNKDTWQTNIEFQRLQELFNYPHRYVVEKDMKEYDRLMKEGLPPTVYAGTDAAIHKMNYIPVTLADARGAVLASNDARDLYYNQGAHPTIYIDKNTYKDPAQRNRTLAHEAEHLMARTGLGHPLLIGKKFEEVAGGGSSAKFIKDASNNLEYLQNKYNINPTYFRKKLVDSILNSRGGNTATPLSEQFATLSAIEQTEGVDLTEDPVLRNNLFSDPEVRQAYRALTGLRQTRLDSKDLDPYRPVSESTKEYEDRGLSGYYDSFMKKISNQLDKIMGRR